MAPTLTGVLTHTGSLRSWWPTVNAHGGSGWPLFPVLRGGDPRSVAFAAFEHQVAMIASSEAFRRQQADHRVVQQPLGQGGLEQTARSSMPEELSCQPLEAQEVRQDVLGEIDRANVRQAALPGPGGPVVFGREAGDGHAGFDQTNGRLPRRRQQP